MKNNKYDFIESIKQQIDANYATEVSKFEQGLIGLNVDEIDEYVLNYPTEGLNKETLSRIRKIAEAVKFEIVKEDVNRTAILTDELGVENPLTDNEELNKVIDSFN